MSLSMEPWDTDVHDSGNLVSGIINDSRIIPILLVREQESTRDRITFSFLL